MRLFTIGYAGRTLEAYLDALAEAGVEVLCDLRRNPVSRKPGFSKAKLAAACARAGLRYEHLPGLGIPSEERRNAKSRDALFAEYERATLPRERAALERIAGWLRAGKAVALTCLEADPADCHRGRVAQAVGRLLDLRPSHL